MFDLIPFAAKSRDLFDSFDRRFWGEGTAALGDFRTDISEDPSIPSQSYVNFQTRPEMRDILLADVTDELGRMCKDGPTPQEMELAVKYLVKHRAEQEKLIAKSLASQEIQMQSYVRWGTPYGYDYEALVRKLKAGDIKAMSRRIAGGTRLFEVYDEE